MIAVLLNDPRRWTDAAMLLEYGFDLSGTPPASSPTRCPGMRSMPRDGRGWRCRLTWRSAMKRTGGIGLGGLMLVVFCLPVLADAAAPPETVPGETLGALESPYIVKKGDTLWGISRDLLNDPHLWRRLWEENTFISNPNRIYPGDRLGMPGRRSPRARPACAGREPRSPSRRSPSPEGRGTRPAPGRRPPPLAPPTPRCRPRASTHGCALRCSCGKGRRDCGDRRDGQEPG